MKYCILIFVFLVSACSNIQQQKIVASAKHEQQLMRYLQLGKLQKAAALKHYIDRANFRLDPEVESQFFMQTCQPWLALQKIKKIQSREKQTLFKATLLALISTERRNLIQEKDPQRMHLVMDKTEVWKDEWHRVGPQEQYCKMPAVIAVEAIRKKYQRISRSLFAQLPEKYFRLDFNLLALAMDVGYRPKGLPSLLAYFHEHRANPYYSRLIKADLFSKEARSLVNPLQVQAKKIRLSGMILSRVVEVPHSIKVPQLLESDRYVQ